MAPPDPRLDNDLLSAFKTALQADENDEALYGWMVEDSQEVCDDDPAVPADKNSGEDRRR